MFRISNPIQTADIEDGVAVLKSKEFLIEVARFQDRGTRLFRVIYNIAHKMNDGSYKITDTTPYILEIETPRGQLGTPEDLYTALITPPDDQPNRDIGDFNCVDFEQLVIDGKVKLSPDIPVSARLKQRA